MNKGTNKGRSPKSVGTPTTTFPRVAATNKERQLRRRRRSCPNTSYLRRLAYGAGGGKASGYGWVCPLHSIPGAAGPGPAFAWMPFLAR